MIVSDIMTRSVVTVSLATPIRQLWRAIFDRRVNAVPVIDKHKKLLGIVTKEDLLKKLYPEYAEFMEDFTSASDYEAMERKIREITTKTAKDVMGRRVIFTRDDTPVMRALSRMITRRVNQLPVLSHDDRVVGMLTKGDVFYAIFKRQIRRVEDKKARSVKKLTKSKK